MSRDGLNAFVTKYDSEGNILWNRAFGGLGEQQARDVAADSRGNVVVAGEFTREIDFGDGPTEAPYELNFVVKLDLEGGHLWNQVCPCPGGDDAGWRSVAVDTNDHIALAGYSDDTNNDDVLVAMLDADGSELWSRDIDGSANQPGDTAGVQAGEQIAIDPAGNLVITGWSTLNISLGGDPVLRGTFVGKLDRYGDAIWIKNIGESTGDSVVVASDRLGNVRRLSVPFRASVDLRGRADERWSVGRLRREAHFLATACSFPMPAARRAIGGARKASDSAAVSGGRAARSPGGIRARASRGRCPSRRGSRWGRCRGRTARRRRRRRPRG